MSEMITKNHALVARFGDTLDRLLDGIRGSLIRRLRVSLTPFEVGSISRSLST